MTAPFQHFVAGRRSTRLERRVQAEFPRHANLVTAALIELTSDIFPSETSDSPTIERIQAAALLVAQGDLGRLGGALVLGEQDWRDLLVAAGLADEGRRSRVAAESDPTADDAPSGSPSRAPAEWAAYPRCPVPAFECHDARRRRTHAAKAADHGASHPLPVMTAIRSIRSTIIRRSRDWASIQRFGPHVTCELLSTR
jgi:hypothetical protein